VHPYVLVPFCACIASATLALVLWTRALGGGLVKPVAWLFTGTAFWAGLEVLWNLAPDAGTAVQIQRLSAIGWIPLGPLCLDGFLLTPGISGGRRPAVRRWVLGLYALAALGVALTWTTPWMLASATPTSWGFGARPGPLFPVFYLVSAGCIGAAVTVWQRGTTRSSDPGVRARGPFVTLAVAIPLLVTSATDVILPIFDVQVPRLGTASFACLGVLHVFASYRYGLSVLLPEGFTEKILHMLPDGVAVVGAASHVRTANREMLRFLGASKEQVVGRRLAPRISAAVFGTADGVRDLECELEPHGGPPLPISLSTIPLQDPAGTPQGFVVIVRDLREMVALRSRLVTSGRLAAVGELAAGIAHEINNPMAYVRANLGMLREHWERLAAELGKGELRGELADVIAEGGELLDESCEGVERATSIVRDVRELSHAGAEREAADLNRLVEQVLRIARPQLPHGTRVEQCFDELPVLPCIPQRLQQVLLNLVVNAAQAIEEGGTIRVVTERRGEVVVARVEDDGPGMAPEVRERVFDPFFTTKPVGQGTGLGLAIAYEIVRQHQGELEVLCPPGGGTHVEVRLPLRDASG
jgi:signal transduction histidine kinase